MKRKIKIMIIIFFDIKGTLHKESVMAGQTTNFAYCDDLRRLRKNVCKLRPELWRQKNWLLHHDNAPSHAFFFTRDFFKNSNMTVVPQPRYFSFFPRLKVKLQGRHFDAFELIEAESQDVLNTLAKYDFHDNNSVCKRTIPTERPPLVGEVSANF
jgi:hypothetical protein